MNLDSAIITAVAAHVEQVDKCGEPYILHPMRVMLSLQTTEQRIVAILHDVIEDTYVTLEELKEYGYSESILEALDAITKRKGEKYLDYIARIKANPIAKAVKIADIKDNSSPLRIYKLDPKTIARLTEKYANALKFLDD